MSLQRSGFLVATRDRIKSHNQYCYEQRQIERNTIIICVVETRGYQIMTY